MTAIEDDAADLERHMRERGHDVRVVVRGPNMLGVHIQGSWLRYIAKRVLVTLRLIELAP